MFIEPCVRLNYLLPRNQNEKNSSLAYDSKYIAAFILDALYRFGVLTFSVFQLSMAASAGATFCSVGESNSARSYHEDAKWTNAMAIT